MMFGGAERLVRSSVPWVIDQAGKRIAGAQAHRAREEARQAESRARYERMVTADLRALAERMTKSVNAGSASGWTMSLPELREQLALVLKVLRSRYTNVLFLPIFTDLRVGCLTSQVINLRIETIRPGAGPTAHFHNSG